MDLSSSPAPDSADTVVVREGTQASFGAARVAVGRVAEGRAEVVVSNPGPSSSKLPIKPGSLLPVGGALYRVVNVQALGAAGGPGSTGRTVTFDRRAVTLPGITLGAGTLVLTLGGQATLRGVRLLNLSIIPGETPGARLDSIESIKGNDGIPRPAPARPHEVRAGAALVLAGKSHRVRAIVPADDRLGVAGWIELDETPSN